MTTNTAVAAIAVNIFANKDLRIFFIMADITLKCAECMQVFIQFDSLAL
ncbi:hypothetical protein Z949_415 [Sulfitobacter guttiformis KCTC 32187]|nr:hypothetical protein Z949_415 [Sulfitobacter guttiformis KCTC 32187]